MKSLIIILLALILISTLSCSDNDKSSLHEEFQSDWFRGEAGISDANLHAFLSISNINKIDFEIDSARINSIFFDKNIYDDEIRFYLSDSSCFYSRYGNCYKSGDIVNLEIFTSKGVCRSSIELLDHNYDQLNLLDLRRDPLDTIALNTPIIIHWSKNPLIDYYEINYIYMFDSAGTLAKKYDVFKITDTSLIFPATDNIYNGIYAITIMSVNGPVKNDQGNITGGLIKGKFQSKIHETLSIIVGNGLNK